MFKLTEEQYKKLDIWMKDQEDKTGSRYGCSGGGYTYSFTPTTLGLVTKVRNNVTDEEIDISDYEDW